MAADRDALELVIGAMLVQSAVCESLIKSGAIERKSLIERLAARRAAWEGTATQLSLFPVDVILSLLAGQQLPAPPGSLN